MPRQLWLADVVADGFRGVKGVRVDAVSGWQSRGNALFDPEGVMDHHTGPGSYANLLSYMSRGSRIAPLCNIATSRPSGGVVRVTIVAAGRANHAGVGELPWRRGQGNTGNRRTIGIEHANTGSQPWPQQHLDVMRQLDAVLLQYMGQGTNRMLDHKTYTRRKVDRHSLNVATERTEVARLMRATTNPATPGDVTNDEWEVFWMSLSNNERKVLQEFAKELAGPQGVKNGASFARQFLMFNREERPRLQEFFKEIDRLDSSVIGQVRAAVTLWREAGARGWARNTESVGHNKQYSSDELGLNESL